MGRALWGCWTQGRIVSRGSITSVQGAELLRGELLRSIWNKLLELPLSRWSELRLSKQKILLLRLNRGSFGNRAHGIGQKWSRRASLRV